MAMTIRFLTLLLVLSGILAGDTIASNTQSPLRFPPRLKYKVIENGQPMANASLFYTKNTGINRFKKDLSSIRLVTFQESETNFQYITESHFFNDTRSLYSDSFIRRDRITDSHLQLKQTVSLKGNNHLYFMYTRKSTGQNDRYDRPVYQNTDISRVSSIFTATQKIASGTYHDNEIFNYYSSSGAGEVTLVYKGRERIKIKGRKISLHVVSLTHNRNEIHRYKIFHDPAGYSFPVSITFFVKDPDRQRQLLLEELPQFTPTQTSGHLGVVFLDFLNLQTGSVHNRTPVENLIHDATIKEIRENLKLLGIQRNKKLKIDNAMHYRLSNNKSIEIIKNILYDDSLHYKIRIAQIFRKLNIPADIDIIVAGQFRNNPGRRWYDVRPIIIIKSAQKILADNLMFERKQLICTSSPASAQENLCSRARDYINYEIGKYFSPLGTRKKKEKGLTVEDIYRMIVQYGFFCHSTDYGYHSQVLEHLRNTRNIHKHSYIKAVKSSSQGKSSHYSYTFKSRRRKTIRRLPRRPHVFKTTSIKRSNSSDNFQLYWAPMKAKMATYQQGLRLVRQLNSTKYQGYSDWRVPTLKELLSISRYDKKEHSFFALSSFFPDQNIKLWTSTPLDELEKRRLSYNDCDVYFVINNMHHGQIHKLQFDVLCSESVGYIVPVRSRYTASKTSPVPGGKKLQIYNLPFMKISDKSPMTSEKVGKLLNLEVKEGMGKAIKKNGLLGINKGILPSDKRANELANIFFHLTLTKKEKINNVIGRIMQPNLIDIMITGVFIDDPRSSMVTVRPVVIYGYDKRMKVKNLQFKRSQLVCRDTSGVNEKLCKQVEQEILNAIKELLDQA